MSVLIPPLVVFLLPVTLTTTMAMAFVLFILGRGWSGYRGLIGAAVFLVPAFWPIRVLLTGTLTTAWLLLRATTNIEAIFWGGLALSVVAIFVLASLIRRFATDKKDKSGQSTGGGLPEKEKGASAGGRRRAARRISCRT